MKKKIERVFPYRSKQSEWIQNNLDLLYQKCGSGRFWCLGFFYWLDLLITQDPDSHRGENTWLAARTEGPLFLSLLIEWV